jgi:hypothetical protein
MLDYALVLDEELVGEDLSEHVPAHNSESRISTGSEADQPATLLEFLRVFSGCLAEVHVLLDVSHSVRGL